jgi:hypothetical protein
MSGPFNLAAYQTPYFFLTNGLATQIAFEFPNEATTNILVPLLQGYWDPAGIYSNNPAGYQNAAQVASAVTAGISTGQAATFGALTATGNVSVGGNVAVVGTNSAAQFVGNLTGTAANLASGPSNNIIGAAQAITNGAYVFTISGLIVSNNNSSVSVWSCYTNTFAGNYIQNLSPGNNASSEWGAVADDGNYTNNITVVGINNSHMTNQAYPPAGVHSGYVGVYSTNAMTLFSSGGPVNISAGNNFAQTNVVISTSGLALNVGSYSGNGSGLTGAAPTATVQGWVTSQVFTNATILRDQNEVVTQMNLTFPDGGVGVFVTTSNNPTFHTVDAYTCTYTNCAIGHLFTQSAILRDASGAATNVPTLTIQ